MKLDNVIIARIQNVAAILIVSVMFYFAAALGRAIWLDEGRLLKSIVSSHSLEDYFNPLPYYDQAQPAVVSFFHHFMVHYVSINVEYIRAATLIISILLSAPIVYVIRKEKMGAMVSSLVFIPFLYTTVYFYTEIKHYAFEISASYIIIFLLYMYLSERINFPTCIILVSLSTAIGFSTFIPAFVVTLVVVTNEIIFKPSSIFRTKNLVAIIIAGIVAAIFFLHMKHLTSLQINNYGGYLSKGLVGDLLILAHIGVTVFGVYFLIAVAMVVVAGLLSNKESFYYRLNIVFILLCALILIGKLTGFYPVIYSRHIVWVTPFAFMLVLSGLSYFIKRSEKGYKILAGVVILLTIIQSVPVIQKLKNGIEITQNNELYERLSELPPSNVVIFPLAQPTLEYYRLLIPDLEKHNYIGLYNYQSSPKYPFGLRDSFIKKIDQVFDNLPTGKFYYLMSGQAPLFSHTASDRRGWRGEYVEMKLHNHHCSYSNIFKGNDVQLLEVSCDAAIKVT